MAKYLAVLAVKVDGAQVITSPVMLVAPECHRGAHNSRSVCAILEATGSSTRLQHLNVPSVLRLRVPPCHGSPVPT